MPPGSHPLRRIPHPLSQGGLPAILCLSCGSSPRHSRWIGWTVAHWYQKTLFSFLCRSFELKTCTLVNCGAILSCLVYIHQREESHKIELSYWENQSKRPCDERQIDVLNKNWNLLGSVRSTVPISSGVWLYILSLTSLKHHSLEIAKMSFVALPIKRWICFPIPWIWAELMNYFDLKNIAEMELGDSTVWVLRVLQFTLLLFKNPVTTMWRNPI